jgi:hypothetical protein
MLEERVVELEKKNLKEIRHIQALAKRVVELMRKEGDEKKRAKKEEASKKEASHSKKKAIKDMVS